MTAGGGWDELLRELDDDNGQSDDDGERGTKRTLDVGTTLVGYWWREEKWEGDYGPTPVYVMVDLEGEAFHFYGGRAALDRKIKNAAPELGDRVAVRRLEDGTPEEGKNPPWRVRIAVKRGDGTLPAAGVKDAAPAEDEDDDIPF